MLFRIRKNYLTVCLQQRQYLIPIVYAGLERNVTKHAVNVQEMEGGTGQKS
jgi:hypothetical protein